MGKDGRDNRVLLALSGGVDSAVAALTLQRAGFVVVGAFMRMWSDGAGVRGECAWKGERRDAFAVGAKLGIPVMTLDFETEYRHEVMEAFFRAYAAGETPNPDILCNSRIKFPYLRREAERLGIPRIATGHYARVSTDGRGVAHLLEAADGEKDQTYFLAGLGQEDLLRTLFPVGGIGKAEVRAIAREAGLPVADKRSTRGICFVGKVDLPDFLRQAIPPAPGEVRGMDGRLVGRHEGLHGFTIGQRHGFGSGGGEPRFVVSKDPATRTLTVSGDEADLLSDAAEIAEPHWIAGAPADPERLTARPRYRAPLVPVVLEGDVVTWSRPQRALTPGQEIVFYRDGECLGGARIVRAVRK